MRNHELSRREFVRSLAAGGAAAATAAGASAPRRPNIVLIMADDMGFSDIGCYGGEIATPNIDSLARGGLRFNQFYNNAKCCPTRSALLTGLYNHEAGVGNMVENLGTPSYQGFLNEKCVTIAEALREGGYTTLMSGKWHVGEQRPHWPRDRGFDRYFGLISGSSNYYRVTEERPLAIDDQPYRPKDDSFYLTDLFGENAVKFLDQYGRQQKPFFLYTAFTSPHWPLHALKEDIEKYRGKYMMGWDELRKRRHARMIEMGIVDRKWPLTPRDPEAPAWDSVKNKDEFDLKMAVYAAQIDRMDQNIGRILRKLEEVGAQDNTLVLFLADNGGCSVEVDRGKPGLPPGGPDSFLSYGLPWANASNTPFRLYKSWVHEGGISTPLIACWPGRIQGGKLTSQPGHIMDVMPTCLELAGVKYPKTYKGREILSLEGRSLAPVLNGKQREPNPALFWEHQGNRAMRQGNLKLVSRRPEQWELYDLEADRTELNNLAGKYPDKVKELDGMYQGWAKRCGVLTPEELRKLRGKKGGGAA
jgi:arylsulfatase